MKNKLLNKTTYKVVFTILVILLIIIIVILVKNSNNDKTIQSSTKEKGDSTVVGNSNVEVNSIEVTENINREYDNNITTNNQDELDSKNNTSSSNFENEKTSQNTQNSSSSQTEQNTQSGSNSGTEQNTQYVIKLTPINIENVGILQYSVSITKDGTEFNNFKGVSYNGKQYRLAGDEKTFPSTNVDKSVQEAEITLEDGKIVTAKVSYE